MGFWKKRAEGTEQKGLTQVALHGASHEELIHEALFELIATSGADRLGVWLERQTPEASSQEAVFRGEAWDRESENVPREWQSISPQTVLPLARLLSGLIVDARSAGKGSLPLVGPVAGLHSVLWVPVQHLGKLRGILMAGVSGPNRALNKEQLQRVAAELTLALAFETERRLASERHSDIALCNRVLNLLQEKEDPERILQETVESCTALAGGHEKLGARFAVLVRSVRNAKEDGEENLLLKYYAGEDADLRFTQMPAIRELARNAVAAKRTLGDEIHARSSGDEGLRVIAVPLESLETPGAVLVAAFRSGTATLGSLDRMELRGRLASLALREAYQRERQRKEKVQLQAILEASGNPMVLLGPDGAIAGSNREAKALLLSNTAGSRDEASLSNLELPARAQFPEFFRVQDRKKVAAWQQEKIRNKSNGGEYSEAELDNGAQVKLRFLAAGDDVLAVGLLPSGVIPSTEETRAQAELLSLTEWLDQGVILFDAEDRVRHLNLRFAQLAGLSPEEVETHKTLNSLVERLQVLSAEPEAFARHWKELSRRTESAEREEFHLLRPTARVLERASRPVLDLAGNMVGRIELYRDLTAQRLFQAKLLQTERLAALGQMVSGVAHELSNPLTSILGYAQRLLLRNESAAYFEEIRKIFVEAERAGAILRRMLLAARESTPERKPVPLNSIVQRTIDLQRFSLAAERIRIDLQLEPDLPQVLGDAGQLQQVLMNLFGNARQAIESQGQGGTIRVRTRRSEDNRVRLEIADSGPGIPESILPRIFDPFFTTKPAGVGTGLGLSIVLSLVREHGGQVHVASPRGGGAEFLVELPAAGKVEFAGMPSRAGEPAEEIPRNRIFSQSRAGMAPRVLIVEDEPTVAQLIADVLRDEGFETEIHLDGRDATERAAAEPFDLIVCDMKMPNVDGQSLYESLQRTKQAAEKRFLFVTGDVLGAKTQEFLSKNRLPHVAKPFRVEELLEKVHQVLQPAGTGARRLTAIRKNSATTG